MSLRLQQPNVWSCLPVAFATIAEIPVNDMITLLSHDGSRIVHPESDHPWIGFHPQEIIWALRNKWSIVEHSPAYLEVEGTRIEKVDIPSVQERFEILKVEVSGVYAYRTFTGTGHAVAWDHEQGVFLDPRNADITHAVEGTAEIFWSMEKRCQRNTLKRSDCQPMGSKLSRPDYMKQRPLHGYSERKTDLTETLPSKD